MSSITIHELERGVLLAERADPPKGVVLRRWLDDSVAAAFDQRVLAVDASVARRAAAVGSSIEPITIPPTYGPYIRNAVGRLAQHLSLLVV